MPEAFLLFLFCFGLLVVPEQPEECYVEGYEVLKWHIDSAASKTSVAKPQSHYPDYLVALNANKGQHCKTTSQQPALSIPSHQKAMRVDATSLLGICLCTNTCVCTSACSECEFLRECV